MRLVKYREKFAAEWWEDGERHRRSLGTDDKLEAQQLLAEFVKLRAATRTKPVSVAEIWDGYRATLEGRPSHTTMGHEWKAVGPFFANKVATLITEADCQAYTAQRLAQGRKPGTIWTELGRLRMSLVWAKKKGVITGEIPTIVRPQQGPPRDKSLTREQAGMVVDACQLPHVRLFCVLALATAGRAGALLGLTWDRVDLDRGFIDLRDADRPVTNKRRALVPLSEGVMADLSRAKHEAMSKYVIEWGGKRVGSVKKGIAAAGSRAGFPWVTPHVFRHTAARLMAEDGVPMSEIAQFLGHDNEQTTFKVYARFSPTHLRQAARSVDFGGRYRD